jgi:hypothetical protein
MSLTCGLLATLLQQWARRYINITQPPYGPRKRARIRAFFAEGLEKRHLHRAVEALPILLHISLFLFFAGLLVLLFNTDRAVFGIVAGWVGICVAVYGYITLNPLYQQDSPYCSPLSSPAWSFLNGTTFVVIRTLSSKIHNRVGFATLDRMIDLGELSRRRFVNGMVKTAEEAALKLSSEIDARTLMWIFDSSQDDHELGRFFAGIPGFCSSKVVPNPFGAFTEINKWTLSDELVGLMHRTLTSNLVSESVRRDRIQICTKAMHATSLSIRPYICEEIINGGWDGLLNYVEFGHFIKTNRHNDPSTAYYSTCMVAVVIAKVKERGDLWLELAMDHLGISAPVLQNYLAHGDSVLLANYIHLLRDITHAHFDQFHSGDTGSRWKVFDLVSQFDIQDTLPSLQHDFCDLWNEIVDRTEAALDPHIRTILIPMLKNVRRAYIALHEGTDSAPTVFCGSTADDEYILFSISSYPLCNIPGHHTLYASNATAPTSPAQQSHGFLPSPTAHNIVPYVASSSYTPPEQLNRSDYQIPPTFAFTSHSSLGAPTHGVANLPVLPQPAHPSSFSDTPTPLSYANFRALPRSVMQGSSSRTFHPPLFDNTATFPAMSPWAEDPTASQFNDTRSRTRSHFSIPATATPAPSPARPVSAVY